MCAPGGISWVKIILCKLRQGNIVLVINQISFANRGSKKKCSVHFIEVKSGNSNLNGHQKNIKSAILDGRVHWHEFNVDGIWAHEERDQHLNINEEEADIDE